jgi:hypothetical protein
MTFNNFLSNIKAFSLRNQPKIFAVLCVLYLIFLLSITQLIFAAIIFYWSGVLFSVVYTLNVIKVPVFQIILSSIFAVRVIVILRTENVAFFLCFCTSLFFFVGFLYFYLENNSCVLRLREQFITLKKTATFLETETEFEYFDAVSILGSCLLSTLFSLRFFYKSNFFDLYEGLDFHEQHIFIITLISTFFIVAVGGF